MIQRIQSIFLFLAALVYGAFFMTPFATTPQADTALFADKVYNVQDHILMILLAGLGGAASLAALLLFKNRSLQLRISYLAIVSGFLLAAVGIIFFINSTPSSGIAAAQINDGAGIYLIPSVLLLLFLAVQGITKDEKTVRSMDRLR